MTTDEALSRITEVDCSRVQYPDGSVARTLATEVVSLREELAEAKAVASYEVAVEWRDKHKRLREELDDELVMSKAAYRETEKLTAELAAVKEEIGKSRCVVDAAKNYLDYLNSGKMETYGGSMRRDMIRIALNSLDLSNQPPTQREEKQ